MGGQGRGFFEEPLSAFSVQVGYDMHVQSFGYKFLLKAIKFFLNELVFYIILDDSARMVFIV